MKGWHGWIGNSFRAEIARRERDIHMLTKRKGVPSEVKECLNRPLRESLDIIKKAYADFESQK